MEIIYDVKKEVLKNFLFFIFYISIIFNLLGFRWFHYKKSTEVGDSVPFYNEIILPNRQ